MITFEPLIDRPLFSVADFDADDHNLNGPSLIRVPDWVERPLGTYYLYFASHTGRAIQMAYADQLEGPWRFYDGGVLKLADSHFVTEEPDVLDLHPEAKALIRAGSDGLYPHIASPDVVVDGSTKSLRLYYHGRLADGRQRTRVAVSTDGLNFTAQPLLMGRPYVRAFRYDNWWYLMGMPGQLYRSRNGLTNWETGHNLFDGIHARHSALLLRGQKLFVFWTEIGDTPERIKLSKVDVSRPWQDWCFEAETVEVHRAVRPWEGSDLPVTPSLYGAVGHRVNQLRDPAVFVENGVIYLLYAIAGEQGLGIGRVYGIDPY